MPYIEHDRRRAILVPQNAGELNYHLTMECLGYVEEHGLRYQTINDIVGALEGAKAEFQRRVVADYEDKKIRDNGDLPWPQ